MRTLSWFALVLVVSVAGLAWLWFQRAVPPPAAPLAPVSAPAALRVQGVDLAPAELAAQAPAEAAPAAPTSEPSTADPRSAKPDLRGGGLRGRVLHARPWPDPWLLDAPPGLQDCGVPARYPSSRLRLDAEGGVADVLIEIPVGNSERHGSGRDVEIDFDACDPTFRRYLLPLGATAVLRNRGARALELVVQGEPALELAQGASRRFTPERAGALRCTSTAHPWLEAELVVTDNRFVTLTDAEGRFEIPGLPRGEYGIVFTHPQLGRRVELDVAIGGDVERELVIEWDPRSKPVAR
ncbi:MAG: carboxypeptidase-like regulatory domain-containing protein [Planctomycetes bacterium]|nr:carboxypeptidase-like regulatory domain-containing protein [Planctomycetota bacterium]